MLTLRRGVVLEAEPVDGGEQRLAVEVSGERRPASCDVRLLGEAQVGDDVVVNVAARDLGLGSGGLDIVHVNLTRGLDGKGLEGAHVLKLNYTSLQHAVEPVEREELRTPLVAAVAVLALHGQLAPVVWNAARRAPESRIGYVQTAGGALPGGHSRVVRELRGAGLLCGHLTAGPAFGGEGEAITVAGAIHHAVAELGWAAVVCGPGPGILGSGSALGHGGMAALDNAHAALALGCETVLVARMSSGDERERHSGLSHHTQTVLGLLLGAVTVALPPSLPGITARSLSRHRVVPGAADLESFAASGLPTQTMGRSISEDPLFFEAALAGGDALGRALSRGAR